MSEDQSDAQPPLRTGRVISLFLRVFFLVALAFTTLGLIESAFITYDLFSGHSLSSQRAPDLGLGIRSWTVHHAMRPGFSSPGIHTNSFGLRSPEVAIPKPAGKFRILLLGDSFTFGLRAREDEIFARRLEARLRNDYGLSSAEVVNAGVVSYCPLLEYLQYRLHLHVLEPSLVVLNFDMSDVQDHMAYARDAVWSSDGVPLYVTEPSLRKSPSAIPQLLSFEWFARAVRFGSGRVESTLEGVPFVRDQDRYLWTLDAGPDWDSEARSAMAPIADLSNLLRQEGVPFLLATYPQPWQVARDATPLPPIREQYGIGKDTVHLNDRPFQKLAKFAAEHAIPFVNATQAFRGDSRPGGLFLEDDLHFSPRGHDLYASVLASYIAEHAPATVH